MIPSETKHKVVIKAKVMRTDGSVEDLGTISEVRGNKVQNFIRRLLNKKTHGKRTN